LIPVAWEKRKPIFKLTPTVGAVGSHASAVLDEKMDFRNLAKRIAVQIGMDL
jgi:chromosome partitioning protein